MKLARSFLIGAFFFSQLARAGSPVQLPSQPQPPPQPRPQSPSVPSTTCIDSLIDLKGSQWRDANTQPEFAAMKKHSAKPTKITVHYTGVKKNPNQTLLTKLKGVTGYSKRDKKWGDMPYNFYIDMNGKSAEGRSTEYRPDTNTNYNPDGHVTIVVEGTNTDDLSPAQRAKLFAMIKGLQNKFNIPTSGVGIHKHYASTDCPGKDIELAIAEYKKQEAAFRPNVNACGSAPAVAPAAPPPVLR
jgi:hypothetical protein